MQDGREQKRGEQLLDGEACGEGWRGPAQAAGCPAVVTRPPCRPCLLPPALPFPCPPQLQAHPPPSRFCTVMPAAVPPKAEDFCTLMYTSGTTGDPKVGGPEGMEGAGLS